MRGGKEKVLYPPIINDISVSGGRELFVLFAGFVVFLSRKNVFRCGRAGGRGFSGIGRSGSRIGGFGRFERGNPLDGVDDLFRRNQTRAFKVAVRTFVARTPEEIEMVEVFAHVIPAAVAGVVVDDTVGSGKFVGGMGEAGNHDDRDTASPGQP